MTGGFDEFECHVPLDDLDAVRSGGDSDELRAVNEYLHAMARRDRRTKAEKRAATEHRRRFEDRWYAQYGQGTSRG